MLSVVRLSLSVMGLAIVMLAVPGAAQAQSSLIDRWYTALFDVNRVALADLLADNATISLKDLGITQNKQEFLDSLDEWKDIVKNADLAWQVEENTINDDKQATVLVCYHFPDSEVLIREVFAFKGSKIISSTQSKAGDSCEEF